MKTAIYTKFLLMMICLQLSIVTQAQETSITINVENAGTLPFLIAGSKKNQITNLTLTGNLNGTDILYIREMAGSDNQGNPTAGKLSILDLSSANIVEGGYGYFFTDITSNNVIGKEMFIYCSVLTSVKIPISTTSIELWAFKYSGINSLTIPQNVKSIKIGSFDGCSKLTTLNVSEGNTKYSSIDGVLFSADKTILITYPFAKSSIYVIPNNVISIGEYAFNDCSELTSVTIPNSVNLINVGAFFSCYGLTSITIPSSVDLISYEAFYYCSGLTSITISNGINSIGSYAFIGCQGLTSITIPNSMSILGTGAFQGCTGLTSLTILNGITAIGEDAFKECTGLTSITIPASVSLLDNGVFMGCTGLTSITIPNSVTTINQFAFRDCSGLISVTIPNSLSSIGYGAFFNCAGLTTLSIPNSVISYGGAVFSGCTSINDIQCAALIPPIVNFDIFSVNYATCKLYVPKGTYAAYWIAPVWGDFANIIEETQIFKTINVSATGSLSTLLSDSEKLFVTDLTLTGNIDSRDVKCMRDLMPGLSVIDLSAVTIQAYTGTEGTNDITTSSVIYPANEMPQRSFKYSNQAGKLSLTSIKLPNSITSIGQDAFNSCYNLKGSFIIPGLVNKIGLFAFVGISLDNFVVDPDNQKFSSKDGVIFDKNQSTLVLCPEGKQGAYTIPNTVTTIADYAFINCYGLTGTIIIPNGITKIGESAFHNCQNLTGKLILPNSLISIGNFAFTMCGGLTDNLLIPNSVITIGDNAFVDCTGLTGLSISNSVTSIGQYAFFECSSLTSLDIGNSVLSIGDYAFYNCNSLNNISVARNAPPIIFDSTFNYINYSNSLLEVPIGASDTYKAANCWLNFFNITENNLNTAINSYVSDKGNGIKIYTSAFEIIIEGTSKNEIITVYNAAGIRIKMLRSQGERIAIPVNQRAVYIVKTKSKTAKVVL